MQTFMPLCMSLNCALTAVIMLAACSKWGKRERPLLSGHSQVVCVKLWISIPIQVSTDSWLALSWLFNVGWSVITTYYKFAAQQLVL